MLGMRRGRPSLIGRAAQTAARTAVITATATTVATKMSGGRPAPAPLAGPVPPAAPPAAGGLSAEAIAKLRELGELRAAGILTEEDFAAQKARLLA